MDHSVLDEFTENTALKTFLNGIEENYINRDKERFNRLYKPMIEDCDNSVFLSVIIRTQGKREEGLREALLCMYAQTNKNFEIILIGHKMNSEQKMTVSQLLEEQEPDFRKKIRYFELNEGTRTVPLNFGFAHARGYYAAVFDDDDILFDNWVSTFWNGAQKSNGRILHSFAFSQDWSSLNQKGYRAESAPSADYCVPYDLFSQLTVNRCPLMTLAFPVNMFQKLGIIFDETLDVTEDWDYFMRLSFLCGVADLNEPTAIYRFWKNIETSATLHNNQIWKDTYDSIIDRFDSLSVVLPPKHIRRIIALSNQNSASPLSSGSGTNLSRLYYSHGSPFNDRECLIAENKLIYPAFDNWFVFEEKGNSMTAMRFDLCEEGLFVLEKIAVTVWFTNGEKHEMDMQECVHNGISYKNSILFLHEDPEIVWEWNDPRDVDVVHVEGLVSGSLDRTPWLSRLESLIMIKERNKKKRMVQKGYF